MPPFFFNPLLSVWISDETLFLVFDLLWMKLAYSLNKCSYMLDLALNLRGGLPGEREGGQSLRGPHS